MTHAATSLAAEAAGLARTVSAPSSAEAALSASVASIRAAEAAFDIDEGLEEARMDELLAAALRALTAAEEAIAACRRATDDAMVTYASVE